MFHSSSRSSVVCTLLSVVLISLPVRPAGAAASDVENSSKEGDGSITIGPEYQVDPDLTDRGNPKGKSFEFTMPLAGSKIFPGDDKTLDPVKKPVRKERKITVYVPAAYQDGTKAPFLIIHDGPGPLGLVRNALDNLTISKDLNRKLPTFIAIAVENGGNDGKRASGDSSTIRCPTAWPDSSMTKCCRRW